MRRRLALTEIARADLPSVAINTDIFSEGDRKSEAALPRHVPAGIVTRRDIAYDRRRTKSSTSMDDPAGREALDRMLSFVQSIRVSRPASRSGG